MPPIQPIRWYADAIWESITPSLPGFTVEVLPHIDSTSTELMRRARAGQCTPTLLVAERQTAGRGRMGRAWDVGVAGVQADGTPDLPSLLVSLGLPLAPQDWSGLSLAVGVSVAESLCAAVGLKWPNDLWVAGDRKLGGILVETANLPAQSTNMVNTAHVAHTAHTAHATQPRYVVIGIGINIMPPHADMVRLGTQPVGLRELLPGIDAPSTLARIASGLVTAVQSFEATGFTPFQDRFNARDILRGRDIHLSDGTTGQSQGVNAHGALLLRTAHGLHTVTSSELSVRPMHPTHPQEI